jgi:hypothetical protein
MYLYHNRLRVKQKMPVAGLSALFTALEDVGEVCVQEE